MKDRPDNPGALVPSRLRCEATVDPLAIGCPNPCLSWIVESSERNQVQTGYQVLVASTEALLEQDQGDIWDSGKTSSDETIAIEFKGTPLRSAQRCWWKVRVWDRADRPSAWSAAASFGMGLHPSDWKAEWIGFDQTRQLDLPPAPFENAKWIWLEGRESDAKSGTFVGSLHLPDDFLIGRSLMAISVSGKYRFYWRGEQFGRSDDEPESWRRPYIRHLNERLRPGVNEFVIEAEQAGDFPPAVLFKAEVWSADGQRFVAVSDESWRGSSEDGKESSGHATTDAEKTVDSPGKIGANWPSCRVIANYGDEPWGRIQGAENILPPTALLRGIVDVRRRVKRATMFATAFGFYDLSLNGVRLNPSYFDPGWTDYRKRLYYRAYDVTEQLQAGRNIMGAVLADGWFSGYIGWGHERNHYGKHPRFRAQVHIEYDDGELEVVGTDSSWKAAIGPTKEADMLMGEFHDAREDSICWQHPDFDDTPWRRVDTGASLDPRLQPHPAPPVVALEGESFVPRAISEPSPGIFIFDLGQNFAGVARLKVRQTRAGQKIVLRFGERLNHDGTLYTINLRTARATDIYICRGAEEEVWTPRFTFHGFQYVEVSGLTNAPDPGTITGIPLSTDTPSAGTFECSDGLTNRLATNIYWSQRSNFIEIPTDCPQRDERLGWCDAAWTFVTAGAFRADIQNFYNKWTIDLDDAQGPDGLYPWLAPLLVTTTDSGGPLWTGCSPAWSDAGIICPWSIFKIYGDRRQLAAHYPAMVRQVEWYRETSGRDLLPPPIHKCLGDWLNYNAPIPPDVFRTAFFAYSTGLLARSAEILGKVEDAARFNRLHHEIKDAFNRAYVDPDGRVLGHTQSAYAFALLFGLVDGDKAEKAALHLVDRIRSNGWRPSTGLEGTLPMMLVLSQIGRNDVAYRLLHSEEFPSWNFSIKNGATTIWERWDSWTPEKGFGDPNMNSFNHFSLGAVYQWIVENIGGIQQDAFAYQRLRIAPTPGGKVTHAKVSYQSVRGLISTDWKLGGTDMDLKVVLPANTSAVIVLPTADPDSITESGLPLTKCKDLGVSGKLKGRVSVIAGSGTYTFHIANPLVAIVPDKDELICE